MILRVALFSVFSAALASTASASVDHAVMKDVVLTGCAETSCYRLEAKSATQGKTTASILRDVKLTLIPAKGQKSETLLIEGEDGYLDPLIDAVVIRRLKGASAKGATQVLLDMKDAKVTRY